MKLIVSVMRTMLELLVRDRWALAMTFVLPVAFFSMFALIFGQQGREGIPTVTVAVVDADQSDFSKRMVEALQKESSLNVLLRKGNKPENELYTAQSVEKAVRDGDLSVALIIPKGFGREGMFSFDPTSAPEDRVKLEILADSKDKVGPQIVQGMIQKATMSGMPDIMARTGVESMEKWMGALNPDQKAKMDQQLAMLRDIANRPAPTTTESESSEPNSGFGGFIPMVVRDVLGETKKNPVIATFAASTAVMFLMFSMAGAGGVLLEEQENGTLERILATRITMPQLLAGKWMGLALTGVAQVILMFVWGWIVFGVELPGKVSGLLMMAIPTAMCASAFGLMLAAACRSRGQLGAVSTLVILPISALGGTMMPRQFMPEGMKTAGSFAFNAWAMDGFEKIFWRDQGPLSTLPQVGLLVACSFLFFFTARQLARKWEVV